MVFSVPLVLTTCAEVIEQHGIVDGIYRLSGVASSIQKLRLMLRYVVTVDNSSGYYGSFCS